MLILTEKDVRNIHMNTAVPARKATAKKETIALLTYMLQHNEHHAQELDQMAENLDKMGLAASAKAIRDAVADFQKSNMRLGLALTLVKEELK